MQIAKFSLLLPIFLAACGSGTSTDEAIAEETTLEEDLVYFSELYDGEYTNFGAGKEDDAVRHYVYRKIDLPTFGDAVVYVQQYYGAGDGDETANIYRQRIYASYADKDRNELVTKIYSFKDDTAKDYVDSQFDPSKLADLKPEDMDTLPDGCEIFWNRDGVDIIGYQKEGVCVMEQPGSGAKMLLIDDLKLTNTSFTTRTQGKDEEGNELFGSEKPLLMYKAGIYNCAVSGGGKTGNLRLHDLNGIASLAGYGFDGKLKLRRKIAASSASPLQIELVAKDGSSAAQAESSNGSAQLEKDDLTASCEKAPDTWVKG